MRTLVLLCCAAAAPALATDDVVEGSVLDSVSGLGIPGARVFVSGCGRYRSGVTGDQGDFVLENLPSCRYEVSVNKAGYVGRDYGTPPVFAKRGEPTRIRLVPTATIEGRVFDEDNKPLEGVNVYAKGRGNAIHAITDEQGHYSLEHLAPGSYTSEIRLPLALRRSRIKRDKESGDVYGYPAIERSSLPLIATAGVRSSGAEFLVRRVRLVEAKGTIVDSMTKQPLTAAAFVLDPGNGGTLEDAGGRRKADRNGTFHADLLEVREYTLKVYRSAARDELPYSAPLNVTRDGVAGATIAVPPPGSIAGVVVWPDDIKRIPADFDVTLRTCWGSESRVVRVASDRSFAFDGVPPGNWCLSSSASFGALQQSIYEAGWRCGNAPCSPLRIPVASQATTQIEVRMGIDFGTVSGKVTADPQERAGLAQVAMVPSGGGRMYRAAAGPDGNFTMAPIPPGSYRAVALGPDANFNVAWPLCSPAASAVEVRKNQPLVLQIKLCQP